MRRGAAGCGAEEVCARCKRCVQERGAAARSTRWAGVACRIIRAPPVQHIQPMRSEADRKLLSCIHTLLGKVGWLQNASSSARFVKGESAFKVGTRTSAALEGAVWVQFVVGGTAAVQAVRRVRRRRWAGACGGLVACRRRRVWLWLCVSFNHVSMWLRSQWRRWCAASGNLCSNMNDVRLHEGRDQ